MGFFVSAAHDAVVTSETYAFASLCRQATSHNLTITRLHRNYEPYSTLLIARSGHLKNRRSQVYPTQFGQPIPLVIHHTNEFQFHPRLRLSQIYPIPDNLKMTISISPLTESDIPGAITAIQEAFAEDPYNLVRQRCLISRMLS